MSDEAAGLDKGSSSEDGSQKGNGEWKPPSDGSWLPKVRVDEMVNTAKGEAVAAREEAARARAETEALRAAAPKAETPKAMTRAELKSLVEDGKITQDAADTYWDKQVIETAKTEATKAARGEVEGQKRDSVVQAQFAEYRKLIPVAWETGSKERAKVEKEFVALREMGFPDNKVTEVAALRAAFGDPEAIKASRSTGKNGPGEAHVEVGGGDRPGQNGAEADGMPKGLTEREKAHYTDKINRGIYKDWKAVTEERKFARAKQA